MEADSVNDKEKPLPVSDQGGGAWWFWGSGRQLYSCRGLDSAVGVVLFLSFSILVRAVHLWRPAVRRRNIRPDTVYENSPPALPSERRRLADHGETWERNLTAGPLKRTFLLVDMLMDEYIKFWGWVLNPVEE